MSTSDFASALIVVRPPNPPPTTTTCGLRRAVRTGVLGLVIVIPRVVPLIVVDPNNSTLLRRDDFRIEPQAAKITARIVQPAYWSADFTGVPTTALTEPGSTVRITAAYTVTNIISMTTNVPCHNAHDRAGPRPAVSR